TATIASHLAPDQHSIRIVTGHKQRTPFFISRFRCTKRDITGKRTGYIAVSLGSDCDSVPVIIARSSGTLRPEQFSLRIILGDEIIVVSLVLESFTTNLKRRALKVSRNIGVPRLINGNPISPVNVFASRSLNPEQLARR